MAVMRSRLLAPRTATAAGARRVNHCTADCSITRPSAPSIASSHARSGCGIRPTTLRASLQRPATFATDPLGLLSRVTWPAAST